MWRWIFFLIGLCVAVLAAVWFVQNPGEVTLEWQGWRLDTSIGILALGVLFFAGIVAALYRFWRFLRRAPHQISVSMRARKQQKGYIALSSGMVAVAAGDANEARRNARRAEALLTSSAPLTRLLSAQSAQLDGDEKAAERFFTEMLSDPETKFLGLRGLLTQAVKAGNRERALELANAAHAMQPKSEWVASTLFELQSSSNAWLSADQTTDEMVRRKLIEKPDAERRRAVIAFELSREAEAAGDRAGALKQLRKASDIAPDLIPAIVALARRYVTDNQHRKAVSLIEKTWVKTPHPDLLQTYWDAKKATTGLVQVKASEALSQKNPDHIESHIALARAALAAELWGEARKHLEAVGAGDGLEPPARVCRMMADLEERENDDLTKAREWLVRAGSAEDDPKWVCDSCGNTVSVWTAHCGNCQEFDSYAWGVPPHKSGLASTETKSIAVSAEPNDVTVIANAPDETAKAS